MVVDGGDVNTCKIQLASQVSWEEVVLVRIRVRVR